MTQPYPSIIINRKMSFNLECFVDGLDEFVNLLVTVGTQILQMMGQVLLN